MTPVEQLRREISAVGGTHVVARWPPDPWPVEESAYVVQVDDDGVRVSVSERNELRLVHECADEQAAVDWLRVRVLRPRPTAAGQGPS